MITRFFDWLLFEHLGKTITAIILILLWFLYIGESHKEKVTYPEAYKAWVKLTGNSNDLSYTEWRNLMKAQKDSSESTTIVPVYIHH